MINTFGNLFKITSFGESHGLALGVVIDGCPAGLELDWKMIQDELDRRKPGQSRIVSQRKESDIFEVLSGHIEGVTTGAPLTFIVKNQDARPQDYSEISQAFRPSHADYTYFAKYGVRDARGGGRASARETLTRVMGGAVAKQVLKKYCPNIQINAWVSAIHTLSFDEKPSSFDLKTEFSRATFCPNEDAAKQFFDCIDNVRKEGDSVGGVIASCIGGVPAGWGEPVFGKLHAQLAAAMFSIHAVKGFEYGSGFAGSRQKGSEQNDIFYRDEKQGVRTRTNHSGGIQGGISNGEDITFRVAFKPTSTILRPQNTLNIEGEPIILQAKGRHDPCVVPRAVPIVEAMSALVLVDAFLMAKVSSVSNLL